MYDEHVMIQYHHLYFRQFCVVLFKACDTQVDFAAATNPPWFTPHITLRALATSTFHRWSDEVAIAMGVNGLRLAFTLNTNISNQLFRQVLSKVNHSSRNSLASA